jgi:hypothetical protein
MGIDSCAMDTLDAKKQFLSAAVEREALVFFAHDPATAFTRIRLEDGKWTIQR